MFIVQFFYTKLRYSIYIHKIESQVNSLLRIEARCLLLKVNEVNIFNFKRISSCWFWLSYFILNLSSATIAFMVPITYGTSEIGALVSSNLSNLICLRQMLRTTTSLI